MAVSLIISGGAAEAHAAHHHLGRVSAGFRGHHHHHGLAYHVSSRHSRYAALYGARVIQCVAFAKQDAGIMISGNARDWWGRAAGLYERGSRPEEGSVLSFASVGRMKLGHVAVVSGIEDSRTILIDQSHWNSRGITRDIEVKDVSEDNSWRAVRVQLGHGGGFGSIYPTHGFIYPRPDRDTAAIGHGVRPAALEVAEAPERARPLDLSVQGISFDSPNRGLR